MNGDGTRQIPTAIVATVFAVGISLGVGYIVDCRRSGGEVDRCWATGRSMVDRAIDLIIGATAGATVGGVVGYWTKNPALHRREDQ
jgi:hypothetical protein